jgi:hypothetical protein
VQAAALLARQRSVHDEEGGLGEVAQLDQLQGERGAAEVLLDLVADQLEPPPGASTEAIPPWA